MRNKRSHKYKVKNKIRFVIGISSIMVIILVFVLSALSLYKCYIDKTTVQKKITYYSSEEKRLINGIDEILGKLHDLPVRKQQSTVKIKEHEFEEETYIISFYDLSVQSCSKKPSHPAYGISRSGEDLRNKNWKDRYIAADLRRFKLGSKVFIKFQDEKYSWLTNVYTVVDSGSAIKGNKIDLYYGENKTKECMELGITEARIIILNSKK